MCMGRIRRKELSFAYFIASNLEEKKEEGGKWKRRGKKVRRRWDENCKNKQIRGEERDRERAVANINKKSLIYLYINN